MKEDNQLSTVIGLGAQKCGSTWLDNQLRAHNQVLMPHRRKEVHFFDRYFDNGIAWYEQQFGTNDRGDYTVRMDITPGYLYHTEAALRIKKTLGDRTRFVIIIRNPVHRSISHFNMFRAKRGKVKVSLKQAIEMHPQIIGYSQYSTFLHQYIDLFGEKSIFVSTYEAMTKETETFYRLLADFLKIDKAQFDPQGISNRIGTTKQPRFGFLANQARKTKQKLRESDQEWLVELGKLAKPLLFRSESVKNNITDDDIEYLSGLLVNEAMNISRLLEVDTDSWEL